MASATRSTVRAALLLTLLAVGVGLTSCDLASAGSTVILNANSTIPPTVRHRFAYTQEDATEAGRVEVVSMVESDDLEEVLARNGFSLNDVVSARVDSVRVTPVSTSVLTAAKLYLGTDAGGPLIADVQLPNPDDAVVDATTRTVTGAVKAGAANVFAQFRVDDPGGIPSGGSVVRATVYFRVEVEGV